MKRLAVFVVLLAAAAVVTAARSGHELPIYPSYYPQEIRIETVDQDQAAGLLLASKIQAYVGGEPRFTGALPDSIRAVETLGSFVVVAINKDSSWARDEASTCAAAGALVRNMRRRDADFVVHPYPVTPFHGDYLYHADLAEAARARLIGGVADGAA